MRDQGSGDLSTTPRDVSINGFCSKKRDARQNDFRMRTAIHGAKTPLSQSPFPNRRQDGGERLVYLTATDRHVVIAHPNSYRPDGNEESTQDGKKT